MISLYIYVKFLETEPMWVSRIINFIYSEINRPQIYKSFNVFVLELTECLTVTSKAI